MSDYFPLSDVISELRDELSKAQEKGKDESIRFSIDEVELSLQVVTGVTGAAKGSGKFWNVVNFEMSGEASKARTHTLKLKMKLVPGDGEEDGPVLLSDSVDLSRTMQE